MWVLSQTFHAGRTYSKATGCYARRKRWVRKMKDADVSLSNIKAVLTGMQTKVTKKLGKKKKQHLYVSLIMADRTIDMLMESIQQRDEFLLNLDTLITADFKRRMANGELVTKIPYHTDPFERKLILSVIDSVMYVGTPPHYHTTNPTNPTPPPPPTNPTPLPRHHPITPPHHHLHQPTTPTNPPTHQPTNLSPRHPATHRHPTTHRLPGTLTGTAMPPWCSTSSRTSDTSRPLEGGVTSTRATSCPPTAPSSPTRPATRSSASR